MNTQLNNALETALNSETDYATPINKLIQQPSNFVNQEVRNKNFTQQQSQEIPVNYHKNFVKSKKTSLLI